METTFMIISELLLAVPLCWHRACTETSEIKTLIINTEEFMLVNFFKAIESLARALIYLLTLIIGLTVTALACYFMIFLSFRAGQFLWIFLFKDPWI